MSEYLRVLESELKIQKSVHKDFFSHIVKTTLDLNDALLTEAKSLAALQHTSLTRLIEEGLQLRLRSQRTVARPVRLPIYRGKGGFASGLDGLSNKEMLDAADRDA